jgi:basic membrane lipoprotein Med (substrate-binding protein (PBP1-ABC) superfamily)
VYIAAILVSVIFYFAGIWSPSMAADQTHPLKIGFVCVGPVNDYGWNQAHNQARLYLEKQLPGQVQTTLAEKISEGSEAERVMERMIAQGNRLIFSTSYGYMEPMLRVAARHPDIIFMQMNRLQTTKNVGTYSQMQYQPMYLAGMVAGHMTKTNKLGFVSAHPVPPMVQSINSFTLGARSVNPKAQTRVVWTNSWSDQMLEAEAA